MQIKKNRTNRINTIKYKMDGIVLITAMNVRTSDVVDGNNSAMPRREETKLAAKFVFIRHKDFREIFVVD